MLALTEVKRDALLIAADIKRFAWLRQQRRRGIDVQRLTQFIGKNCAFRSVSIGTATSIERDVTFWLSTDPGADSRICIAERVFIGRNSYIGAFQPVQIGATALIGAYSYIISGNHVMASRDAPIRDQGFVGAPVILMDDCWLGTHAVVLPGVTVGRGAVVAAGSVVNHNIPDYEVWGGVPARFIRHRD